VRCLRIVPVVVIVISITGLCRAEKTNAQLEKENQRLQQRVDRLEKQLEELRKIVMQQTQAAPQPLPPPADKRPQHPAAVALTDSDWEKLAAMVAKGSAKKKPVWSDLDIELYGYIKADASYDTSRVHPGNFVLYLDPGKTGDSEFNLTAKQTRLGLRISGPEDIDTKTTGRVEIDFYGGNATENQARIQMRHAYLKIDWPHKRFSILAGQTSDVISPLYPNTLNYTVLWDAGNIGYRRPQIRLTKNCRLSTDTDLQLDAAVARTIGDDDLNTKSGEDAGFPTFQSRAGITFPWFGYKPTTVGISGHWGLEEYNSQDTESWSVNLDLTQPINEWLTLKAELFDGENLDTYFGGIGQGVNESRNNRLIGSRGGWFAAALGPWGKWSFNLGVGMDDVDASDTDTDDPTANPRILNRSVFGNMIYSVNKNTQIGLEVSHWRTEYNGSGDADDLRAQTSFIYKF